MSLKVIIIGAGIGGTAAAHALLRVGCQVRIYEQVNAKTEVGAGIQISPNASRLLWRYGLAEALKQRAVRPAALEVRRWDDGATLSREDLGDTIEREYGAGRGIGASAASTPAGDDPGSFEGSGGS